MDKVTPRGKTQVKQALIDAGIKLFSERGMSSVSVRELAEEAGVNHSLLFRHFGDKDTLIKAVFETRFAQLGDYSPSQHQPDTMQGERILEASIRAIMKDEALLRLMTYAALEGGEENLNAIPSPFIKDTLKKIKQRQDNNEIYNGVEASVLIASGFALALGWAIFRKTLKNLSGARGREFEELRVQVDKLWDDMLKPRE